MLVDYLCTVIPITFFVILTLSLIVLSFGIGYWIEYKRITGLVIFWIALFIFCMTLIFTPHGDNLREILTEALK